VTTIEVLGDGDVRLEFGLDDGRTGSRRFRAHFGHVVEVSGDKLRRVGADLSYREPALLVRATLAETVRQAGSLSGQPAPTALEARAPVAEPASQVSPPIDVDPTSLMRGPNHMRR
jgi:hypothetical protein